MVIGYSAPHGAFLFIDPIDAFLIVDQVYAKGQDEEHHNEGRPIIESLLVEPAKNGKGNRQQDQGMLFACSEDIEDFKHFIVALV